MDNEVYSHGHHESVVRAHAVRTAADSAPHLLPHLAAGQRLLDVGCGPGSITLDLARLIAAPDGSGRAVGVDRSEDVLATARARAAAEDVVNVGFEVGNIYDLQYDDGSFDIAHAHQVLHHLVDPVAAVRELRRVTAPGGLVALREADYAAMSWYPESPALARWREVYDRLSRSNGAEPNAGRRLLSWALAAGFDPADLQVSASTWIHGTEASRNDFGLGWAERALHSSYAEQALERGIADQQALQGIAAGWRQWAADPAGVFIMPSVELIARVGED
ncbi:methyltransferase domain-containing protein [Arthrobacter sp. JSM 101049]|uniref:methyltransferase domain-containing protein n=1 Tax=Arthrobacter sp. JSM 101049 TaxID=929097 RepID=UPI003566D07D